jgi:hypothetical protein
VQLSRFDIFEDSDPAVDDLQPETIEGVATRTAESRGFAELVYRECEINALWSLADIGLSGAAHRATGSWKVGRSQLSQSLLARLRDRFEEAYLLLADSSTSEASRVLVDAAALSSTEATL